MSTVTIYIIDFDLHRQIAPNPKRLSNVDIRFAIEKDIAVLLDKHLESNDIKFWERSEHDETMYEIHFDDAHKDSIEPVINSIHKVVLSHARKNDTGYKIDTRLKGRR